VSPLISINNDNIVFYQYTTQRYRKDAVISIFEIIKNTFCYTMEYFEYDEERKELDRLLIERQIIKNELAYQREIANNQLVEAERIKKETESWFSTWGGKILLYFPYVSNGLIGVRKNTLERCRTVEEILSRLDKNRSELRKLKEKKKYNKKKLFTYWHDFIPDILSNFRLNYNYNEWNEFEVKYWDIVYKKKKDFNIERCRPSQVIHNDGEPYFLVNDYSKPHIKSGYVKISPNNKKYRVYENPEDDEDYYINCYLRDIVKI
jgi:hypothetical protein